MASSFSSISSFAATLNMTDVMCMCVNRIHLVSGSLVIYLEVGPPGHPPLPDTTACANGLFTLLIAVN